MKHDWYTHDRYGDGTEIDNFRLDQGYHNGPECRRCEQMFCHHCEPDCYEQECESGQMDIFEVLND